VEGVLCGVLLGLLPLDLLEALGEQARVWREAFAWVGGERAVGLDVADLRGAAGAGALWDAVALVHGCAAVGVVRVEEEGARLDWEAVGLAGDLGRLEAGQRVELGVGTLLHELGAWLTVSLEEGTLLHWLSAQWPADSVEKGALLNWLGVVAAVASWRTAGTVQISWHVGPGVDQDGLWCWQWGIALLLLRVRVDNSALNDSGVLGEIVRVGGWFGRWSNMVWLSVRLLTI
jgi:hypothetical protein